MKWTTDKPTKAGWYWVKTLTCVSVNGYVDHFDGELIGLTRPEDFPSSTKWAGPIKGPTDKDPLENLQYVHIGLRKDSKA